MPRTHIIRGEVDPRPDVRFHSDQNRKSNNYSAIEQNLRTKTRNPIQGLYNDKPLHGNAKTGQYILTTDERVSEANRNVPPLRSVGAVRTWAGDSKEMFRADGY